MRIGITCYPTYGGSGVVATELGAELAARGHDVHFISYAPPIRMNPNDPHTHFHEVEVASYPLFDHPPYTLALATKMLEVFESEALDLLHVHYAIPHSVSAMLARSMAAPRRLPFITTLHGTDITMVREKMPSKLVLIGDGPDRGAAEYLVRKKKLQKDVIFLGKQDQVYEKLALADLFLLPSQLESFGLAALEAMAGEVPVIPTNVGGLPEVVEHGVDGYLVEPGDVKRAGTYAIEILSRADRGREMGHTARLNAKQKFCANDVIPQYERYYQRVLESAAVATA